MSFQEDCDRFGNQLTRLVDAGIPVKEAAAAIGLPRQRCYAILRAIGRPVGKPRGRGGTPEPQRSVAVYGETGSISAGAGASGVAQSVARRSLVAEGMVSKERISPKGKPETKRRCLEVVDAGGP